MDPRQYGPELWPHASQMRHAIEKALEPVRPDPGAPPARARPKVGALADRRGRAAPE